MKHVHEKLPPCLCRKKCGRRCREAVEARVARSTQSMALRAECSFQVRCTNSVPWAACMHSRERRRPSHGPRSYTSLRAGTCVHLVCKRSYQICSRDDVTCECVCVGRHHSSVEAYSRKSWQSQRPECVALQPSVSPTCKQPEPPLLQRSTSLLSSARTPYREMMTH